MADCDSARAMLQRALTSDKVAEQELAEALRHLETCERCESLLDAATMAAARLDVAREPATGSVPALGAAEAEELVERALADGLAEPEAITRERAVLGLGERGRLRPSTFAKLADVATRDGDERVRAAALEAMARLDEREPLARRVIDAWPAAVGVAAHDVAAALARLAAALAPRWRGIDELQGLGLRSALRGPRRVRIEGPEGAGGRLEVVDGAVWLTLTGLPPGYEGARPTVAVPQALDPGAPAVHWAGDRPGLVTATATVEAGSVKVLLGNVAGAAGGEEALFARVYLLAPPPGP